jgi:hypothetical protein
MMIRRVLNPPDAILRELPCERIVAHFPKLSRHHQELLLHWLNANGRQDVARALQCEWGTA